jgi:hypothetical protein
LLAQWHGIYDRLEISLAIRSGVFARSTVCLSLHWQQGVNGSAGTCRDIVARIEAQIRLVTDSELLFLARTLDVRMERLFSSAAPKVAKRRDLGGA